MVPDQSIGVGGRTVRCAKCQHSWFVGVPKDAPMPGIEALVGETNKTKPLPPGSNLPVIKYPSVSTGFKASVFGSLAAAIALLLLAAWPQVYGYPPSDGLVLAEVNMLTRYDEKHPEKNIPIYEINGKILNQSGETLEVPVLRITVVDKEGEPLQYWDFSEPGRTLEAGKNIPFTTGPLDIQFTQPSRFVVELGNTFELALRQKVE